jgi:hypothetical protein
MRRIVKEWQALESEGADFVVEALAKELPSKWISDALRKTGKTTKRKRLLPAGFMLWFVVLLGLFRRVSYANLLEKLVGSWWVAKHWPKKGPPTSSAVSKARDRLGVEPVRHLWKESARAWSHASGGLIFHGRRVYALDGSTFKTPDMPENHAAFGKPGASRGRAAYPQMRAVLLVDVGPRLVRGERHGPYSRGETPMARELVQELGLGTLVLYDRNFLAYDLLWDTYQGGRRDFMVRVPKKIKPRLVKRLAPGDALVEVTIPRWYRRLRPDMPKTWTLRMISYRPAGSKETIRLFTTLTDPAITRDELAALYHERWEEETVIDEIKTHLCECHTVDQAVVFRSHTPLRVEQEWYGLLLAYNAVRKLISSTVPAVQLPPARLSFTGAVERLREAAYEMMRLPAHRLPARYAQLLLQVGRLVVPERPGRKNSRAVKIKMSKFPLKCGERGA